jgi:DNA-binding GntR family transcriptional regulator
MSWQASSAECMIYDHRLASSSTESILSSGTISSEIMNPMTALASAAARLAPIQTFTLQDQIYRQIKREIMAGRFKPGQTFSMQTVADALGTSTMPVREAFRRLAAERAVEIHPKRAIRIPMMSRDRFIEIADMRLALEGLATTYAARRISHEEIKNLERVVAEAEAARERSRIRTYLAKNQEFHFAVYTAARSHVLMPVIESLWLQIGPVLALYTKTGINIGAEYHGRIIKALRTRDEKASRNAMIEDIGLGIQYFLEKDRFA